LKRLLLVHGHWSYSRNGNMIVNFFYKNIICIGVLWWFQIYCGWSSQYVFEYTYLLFWNSFWTIAPVVAIGLFDRIVDDDVLMALPELYRFGREGHWFNIKLFLIYMLDGVYQATVIYFLTLYAYRTPSARSDGFDVAQYEFATTMAMAAILAANLFNGLNTNVWTGWVFFAVAFGIVFSWVYTAIYSIISPGWFSTPVYGNDHFLFLSPYYWFCIVLTVIIALAPRYLLKAYKFIFAPDDIDIMRWARKVDKTRDFGREAHIGGMSRLRPQEASRSGTASRRSSFEGERPTPSLRNASRTDMSTGLRSVHRGFDFATEESGPAMRRLQSNLSGAVHNSHEIPASSQRTKPFSLASITRPLRRKRPSR
jgi:phospholipid-translocating ATPase